MPPKDEVETVIDALRRYTSDNPHACDTPDGIARWWLQSRHAPRVVVLALERLGEQGLLERLPATDGRVRYRRGAGLSGLAAITATGMSLQRLLLAAFAERSPLIDEAAPGAPAAVPVELVNTRRLAEIGEASNPTPLLTLYLYRVDVDKSVRATWSAVGSAEGRGRLPLNLHYLLTAWAGDAATEQRLLGRALQALETTPVLTGPLLLAPAGLPADEPAWEAQEAVYLGIEDLPTEALMRIFDTLPVDHQLSVPYCARVVRIDGRRPAAPLPVLDAQVRLHSLRAEVQR